MAYSLEQVRQLLVDASEQFIVPRYNKLLGEDVRDKGQGQGLVTVADMETEDFLSRELCRLDSSSCCVGEEAVAEDPSLIARLDDPQPVWVIDPVDGTRNFVKANDNFCVMVARVENNIILQSWIYMPLTGECLIAEAGQGAFLFDKNGQELNRLKTNPWTGLDASFGRISFAYFSDEDRRLVRERAERALRFRKSIGSAGCEYALVAKGQLDYAVFNRLKVWDHAAGTLIVREAGGDCRLIGGKQYEPTDTKNGNMVGASFQVNEAVLALLCDNNLRKEPDEDRLDV